ncbi:MAG TPA: hypothetical protein V6D22_18985, partial [Candidatus Obscuribacterales bacterium]
MFASRISRTALSLIVAFAQTTAALAAGAGALPANLNLGSRAHSVVATNAASIIVGGKPLAITPGQLVTPAEAAAVSQLLMTGRQSLLLAAHGNAIGGSLILPGGANFGTIMIPTGLSVLRDFNGSPQLSITGNLTNAGKFFAISTDKQLTAATINATDIFNRAGAVLTSTDNLSLNLNVSRLISNAGTISSGGDLSITGVGSSLHINNIGGTISAGGNLNLNLQNAQANGVLSVVGGNLLSQQVNVNTGAGKFDLNVQQMPGL